MKTRYKTAQKLLMFIFLSTIFCTQSYAEDGVEPVHYAYANYLGSGIYRASEKDITLINLPFFFGLKEDKHLKYSLRAPVSFGFFSFSLDDIPELEIPNSVGSITFTPGIQVDYQLSDDLIIQSYFDVGFARNFTTKNDVFVHSAGVSSLYSFTRNKYDTTIATRIYYAAYRSFEHDQRDSYVALQIGVDTGYRKKFKIFNQVFQPRVFATSYWYFSEVNLISADEDTTYGLNIYNNDGLDITSAGNVTLNNSFEMGATMKFDKYIGYAWANIDTIGLSYRFNGDYSAMRLLFTFPI